MFRKFINPKYVLVLLAVTTIFTACNNNSNNNDNATAFDRKAMLQNYADQVIIPAYAQLLVQTQALNNALNGFVQNPASNTLQTAQTALEGALLAWQQANAFNFGPAGEMGIRKSLNEEIGVFPVSVIKTENYINNGDTSFANFDRDTRGFYALDYLLFNNVSDSVIAAFANTKRKNYLMACANHLLRSITPVNNAWQGAYKAEFVNNTGTDIGSSTSVFYNEYVKSFEALKNFKFGVPLGLRPGQTQPLPQHVEAYYSGLSVKLALAHWQAVKNMWNGISITNPAQDGIGLKEYLKTVTGGETLVGSTQAQMAAVDFAFTQINTNQKLSEQISSNFEKVNNVHTELQKQTRFLKSDLSSLIGVAITFSSGDGD